METKAIADYRLIPELGVLVNAAVASDYDGLKNTISQNINPGAIIQNLRRDLTDEEIMAALSSTNSLCLSIEDGCNYRCGYCVYSGIYEGERTHSTKHMSIDTATKGINFYLDLINGPLRFKKNNKVFIAFYGGEPLLRFELIPAVIDAAEKQMIQKKLTDKFTLSFRMNTNGYLLTNEVIDFLHQKKVYLDISLDGPEEEHDKFRRTMGGEGTWKRVMENIQRLRTKYPDYYQTYIQYLCTIHPQHDLIRIESFFKSHPDLFDIASIRFSTVNIGNLKPGIKEDLERLSNGSQRIGKELLANIAEKNLQERFGMKNLMLQSRFTGACIPGGSRLFMDTSGRFHMCEKINPLYSIGDVDHGLDFEKIRQLVRQYNEQVIANRCWECDAWSFCNLCYASAAKGNQLDFSDCKKNADVVLQTIVKYLDQEEEINEMAHANGLGIVDYLDQL